MKKHIIFLIIGFMVSLNIIFAQSETDFEITISNDTVTITDYKGKSGKVIIPENIQGMPVVEIGERAFLQKHLTSIIIPKTVRIIGQEAFRGNNLRKIIVPDTVISIGIDAFYFQFDSYKSEGINAFFTMQYKNEITIMEYNGWGGDVVIPERIDGLPVVAIGRESFTYSRISKITIPNTVRIIEAGAFTGNYLQELYIPNSVISIGHNAFSNNNLFHNITIPDSVKNIGFGIFSSNPLNEKIRSELQERFGEEVVGNNNVIHMW